MVQYRIKLAKDNDVFVDSVSGIYLNVRNSEETVTQLTPAIAAALKSGKLIDMIGNAVPIIFTNVQVVGMAPKGKETLTVAGVAVPFASVPVGATKAYVTCETVQIRYWIDGSTPTTTAGHLVAIGGSINPDSAAQLKDFKAIAVSGSATLQVTYF